MAADVEIASKLACILLHAPIIHDPLGTHKLPFMPTQIHDNGSEVIYMPLIY